MFSRKEIDGRVLGAALACAAMAGLHVVRREPHVEEVCAETARPDRSDELRAPEQKA